MGRWAALGGRPTGDRLLRMQRSPQRLGDAFVNRWPVRNATLTALTKWLRGAPHREPTAPLPVVQRSAESLAGPPPAGPRVTWFGHSSVLVEVGGGRFLTDPVWSERASPSPRLGPKRFFAPPAALEDLPPLDAVVLSHDHFDKALAARPNGGRPMRFVAPLGVGAHLAAWGIAEERIEELDWWEHTVVAGVELVCTPARHFSGRGLSDGNRTLWGSWVFRGADHRVFFSGDSGMFPGFREIGQRFGPFALTLIEAGAYDAAWADVHLGPEQALQAHRDLGGELLVPIHWGTFNLALHAWTEPAERLLVGARAAGARLALPRPGESVDGLAPAPPARWWPDTPWKTAAEAPVVSSGWSDARGEPTVRPALE